jgi:hypothetical protein
MFQPTHGGLWVDVKAEPVPWQPGPSVPSSREFEHFTVDHFETDVAALLRDAHTSNESLQKFGGSSQTTPTPAAGSCNQSPLEATHGGGKATQAQAQPQQRMPSGAKPPLDPTMAALVINPDMRLLPTFNSAKSVEDILLDQAQHGPYVSHASYDDVFKWCREKRPSSVNQNRSPIPGSVRSTGNSNISNHTPGSQEQSQIFIGQLPSFVTEELLTMCLDYVHGIPGSVLHSLVRRETGGSHAGYALATLASSELVPRFIALNRHLFLGRSNIFFAEGAEREAPEFQRIVARVMAIDASRTCPEQISVGYARACLVIALANPPTRGGATSGHGGRTSGRKSAHHPPSYHQTPSPTPIAFTPPHRGPPPQYSSAAPAYVTAPGHWSSPSDELPLFRMTPEGHFVAISASSSMHALYVPLDPLHALNATPMAPLNSQATHMAPGSWISRAAAQPAAVNGVFPGSGVWTLSSVESNADPWTVSGGN